MSISLKVFDEESNISLDLILTQEEYDRAIIDTEYLRELVEKEKCNGKDNMSVAVTDALQPETSIESHDSPRQHNTETSLESHDLPRQHNTETSLESHDSPRQHNTETSLELDDPHLQDNTEISVVEEESTTTSTSLYIWTTPCVLLLLSLYEDNKENFNEGSKRHKKIWDDIAKKMKEIDSKYTFTGGQCQTKMNGLKRTYKKIKDHNQKSGNDRASWPFFQRMDEIFGRNGWAQPLATASEAGPSCSNLRDVPEKKKIKPNPIQKYLNELKEEHKQKTIERERARQQGMKLKQEQFKKLLDLKERQHLEKLELIKSLFGKK